MDESMLEKINTPQDLKSLSYKEKEGNKLYPNQK